MGQGYNEEFQELAELSQMRFVMLTSSCRRGYGDQWPTVREAFLARFGAAADSTMGVPAVAAP